MKTMLRAVSLLLGLAACFSGCSTPAYALPVSPPSIHSVAMPACVCTCNAACVAMLQQDSASQGRYMLQGFAPVLVADAATLQKAAEATRKTMEADTADFLLQHPPDDVLRRLFLDPDLVVLRVRRMPDGELAFYKPETMDVHDGGAVKPSTYRRPSPDPIARSRT